MCAATSLLDGVSTSIGTQFHLHSFNIVISFSIGYLFIYLCQFQLLMKAYHQLFICYRFVFWIIVFPFSFCVCRCETGALFVIVNKAPSLKMLGLLQVVLVYENALIQLESFCPFLSLVKCDEMYSICWFALLGQFCFLKLFHCMKGFAAGLMLSISFFDLAHNALNSLGFLKGNLWVGFALQLS